MIGLDLYQSEDGICHGDELFLQFKSQLLPLDTVYGEGNKKTSQNLLKMWTDFAATGDPTPDPAKLHGGVKWER